MFPILRILLVVSFQVGCVLPLPAWQSPDEGVSAHFQAGQAAIKSGETEVAIREFQKVLSVDPTLLEAKVNLGLAYHLAGQYTKSTAVMADVAHTSPDLIPAQLFLGIGYLKLGAATKAIAPLTRVVRLDQSNSEARKALGACYLAEGNYREAAKQFQALSAITPDSTEALFQLGSDYTEAASRLVRTMSLKHRRTAWGHRLAADLYFQSRRWELAAQEYRDALTINPVQPGLNAELGKAYLPQGKLAEAEAGFRKELDHDPLEDEARFGQAEIEIIRGDLNKAREQLEPLWQRSPEIFSTHSDFPATDAGKERAAQLATKISFDQSDGPSLYLAAALYRAAGQPEKAHECEAMFQHLANHRGAEQSSAAPAALDRPCENHRYAACERELSAKKQLTLTDYVRLGEARFVTGQFESASDAFAAGLALDKNDPQLIYYLSRSYERAAAGCFRRMAEQAPDSWRTHQMLAETYRLRSDDEHALREFERAVQLQPDSAELREQLGGLYLQDGQRELAKAMFDRALQLEPNRPRTLAFIGRWYAETGDPNQAVPYLQKALQYDGTLLAARVALGKLFLHTGKPADALAALDGTLAFDLHGDLHYLAYRAYRDLGKEQLARAALRESMEIRKNSVARDEDKLDRWMQN
jgi:tetratricopeptide (TPR) repeat protein